MPTVGYYPDEEETRRYTSQLFTQLTRRRFIENGLKELENEPKLEFLCTTEINNNTSAQNSSLMKQIAKDLIVISDEFARSSERNRVREKAQQVNINQINYGEFQHFLNELFSNGITRERIVVLFFFCSDVVVRAYANPMADLKRLFNWFLDYIINRVCNWVANNGGWGVVLGTYVPSVSQTIFYWVSTAVLVCYIYKKIFR